MARNGYYTLRSAWQADGSDYLNQGYMNIFTHVSANVNEEGISAGSQWVADLNIGDVVFSRTETADKHPHLATGQNLLIADETAYPALVGILDLWQNDLAPEIIIVSQQQNEQDYFSEKYENVLPANATIYRVVKPVAEQTEAILKVIENIDNIDGVWGALENNSAKRIRHYLRNQCGLSGKVNHVKGYWRLK
ncbi:MAG: hypothetical protein CR962_01210 [Gammaproteobacteria bacterium]|nr:MAG: hypothetical protein CR962_01210 [Gammaproteobacteria bacterium]